VVEVAWELRHHCAAVALDFLVTLAVFPGVASAICPSQNEAGAPPCTPRPHAGRLYGERHQTEGLNCSNLKAIGCASRCETPQQRHTSTPSAAGVC
jgi:hypothetical protein